MSYNFIMNSNTMREENQFNRKREKRIAFFVVAILLCVIVIPVLFIHEKSTDAFEMTTNKIQVIEDSTKWYPIDESLKIVKSTDEWKREITGENSLKVTECHYQAAKAYLETIGDFIFWKNAFFLGDSLTYGMQKGLTINDSITISYPQVLAEACNIENININAQCGTTFSTAIPNGYYARRDDFPETADAVFVMGGINDVLNSIYCKFGDADTPGTSLGDAKLLFDYLNEKYPEADIFYVVPYLMDIDGYFGLTVDNTDELELMTALQKMAEDHEFYIIDLHGCGFLDTLDKSCVDAIILDGFHPNDIGYKMMGTMIGAEAIRLKTRSLDGMEGYNTNEVIN